MDIVGKIYKQVFEDQTTKELKIFALLSLVTSILSVFVTSWCLSQYPYFGNSLKLFILIFGGGLALYMVLNMYHFNILVALREVSEKLERGKN